MCKRLYQYFAWLTLYIERHQTFFSFSVYILTDDQDIKLGSLKAQPVVQSLLVEQGLFFNNAFVTTPVCCPSRYSLVLMFGDLLFLFLEVLIYALSEVDIDVDIFSRLPEDKETVLRGR